MKYLIAGLVAVVFLCSINHANAIVSEQRPYWEKLGLYDLAEFVTANPSWKPGKDYTDKDSFPHFRCHQRNIECSKLRGLYESEYQHWLREKDRAYNCYRHGRGCDVCIRNGSAVSGCSETKPAQHPRYVHPAAGRQ